MARVTHRPKHSQPIFVKHMVYNTSSNRLLQMPLCVPILPMPLRWDVWSVAIRARWHSSGTVSPYHFPSSFLMYTHTHTHTHTHTRTHPFDDIRARWHSFGTRYIAPLLLVVLLLSFTVSQHPHKHFLDFLPHPPTKFRFTPPPPPLLTLEIDVNTLFIIPMRTPKYVWSCTTKTCHKSQQSGHPFAFVCEKTWRPFQVDDVVPTISHGGQHHTFP